MSKKNGRILKIRTERAMKRAMQMHKNKIELRFQLSIGDSDIEVFVSDMNGDYIAVFPLSMCYQKRMPLTGIGKAVAALTRARPKKKR